MLVLMNCICCRIYPQKSRPSYRKQFKMLSLTHLNLPFRNLAIQLFTKTSWKRVLYRQLKKASGRNTFKMLFLFGPASARSYKIGAVGNIWLVGNAVFSEMVQRIFLIFCMKLGTIKVEKSQSRIFEKNSWFGDIFVERSPN